MNLGEFAALQSSAVQGTCDRASRGQCFPSKLATHKWQDGDEIYLSCDHHAPGKAEKIEPHGEVGAWLKNSAIPEYSAGNAKLRSLLSGQFGARLQSTGDAASDADSFIIFQTLDASPENPYMVEFAQYILAPFTGPGQFDLVERDSIRRVFDGASAGGTPVLTSETMNFQPEDEDQVIQIGRQPGRYYKIVSVDDSETVTLDRNITLPSSQLTLTLDGHEDSEVTIATKAGLTDGATSGVWSRFSKAITSDKTYSVVFVPGTTGDGIYTMSARALQGPLVDPTISENLPPEPEPDIPGLGPHFDAAMNNPLNTQEAFIGALIGLTAGAMIGVGMFVALGTTVGTATAWPTIGGVTYWGLTAVEAAELHAAVTAAIATGTTLSIAAAALINKSMLATPVSAWSRAALAALLAYVVQPQNAGAHGNHGGYMGNNGGGSQNPPGFPGFPVTPMPWGPWGSPVGQVCYTVGEETYCYFTY